MTRINILRAKDLTDQHLLAEHRELPRIFKQAADAYAEHRTAQLPPKYTMGTGHVRFFYDKTAWLAARHRTLSAECARRGFKVQQGELTPLAHSVPWEPTAVDLEENLKRLREKLAAPPWENFYRYCGVAVAADWYDKITPPQAPASGG